MNLSFIGTNEILIILVGLILLIAVLTLAVVLVKKIRN